MLRKKMLYLVMSGAALVATGCDGITSPGEGAEVAVVVEGREAASTGSDDGANARTTSGGSIRGSVDVKARVYVQSATGEWREVTRGAAEQRVEVSGDERTGLLVRTRIRADDYRRVRVEFESVRADVEDGFSVGLGVLTGEIRVTSGSSGAIVVEREASFSADARTETRIRVSLNAEQWLQRANAGTRTVAEADFRSAVGITVH